MILKTDKFQNTCKIIAEAAAQSSAARTNNLGNNLELFVKNKQLYLNNTNKEHFVSCRFDLETEENFHATVDANLFLSLVSGLTTDTFELKTKDNNLVVKAGRSNYKLAMIYEGLDLLTLPTIKIINKTVEMPISLEILRSILQVNSRELQKAKYLDSISELQKMYYIDETGCFTFTSGACLNAFTLAKPVKLLLNERIVKLFKLFKTDVNFSFGYDQLYDSTVQAKAVFESDNIYVAALVTCDDILINKVQGPCTATKALINEQYTNRLVLSVNELSAAIGRLLTFSKNSVDTLKATDVVVGKVVVQPDAVILTDMFDNEEVVKLENDIAAETYTMKLNLVDLKLSVDAYKNDHITLSCGSGKAIIISCKNVHSLLPELGD